MQGIKQSFDINNPPTRLFWWLLEHVGDYYYHWLDANNVGSYPISKGCVVCEDLIMGLLLQSLDFCLFILYINW